MKDLIIKIANDNELRQIMKIRKSVFHKEQKVPKELVIDSCDAKAKHIIMLLKNKPIGCARIRFKENKGKLERIAILKEYRGRGFGKPLMKYLVNYCRRKKVNKIFMHAQYHAKGFYEKTGFVTNGKQFIEADIKHIEMIHVRK